MQKRGRAEYSHRYEIKNQNNQKKKKNKKQKGKTEDDHKNDKNNLYFILFYVEKLK